MKHTGICLIILSAFLAGCSRTVSIDAEFNGTSLHRCGRAQVSKLGPGNGGYRFICSGNSSVYVIYDTATNKDGSIVSVEIETPAAPARFLPAVFASSRGSEDCPSAKQLNRQTGEAPLTLNWLRQPANGTYELAMARPCGTLSLKIADAEPQ
jgi:hypothetical protein